MNLFPDRSRCLNAGYLFKEWFFAEPKVKSLLFLASIDSKVGIVPKVAGKYSKIFLFMIKYFNEVNWPISSLNYFIWLSDRFKPFKFFVYTIESTEVIFIFLNTNYPPWLNSLIIFTQYYFSVDCCSKGDSNLFYNWLCSSGGILSFRYFFNIFVPPFLMFCLIVFNGFP